MTEDELISAYVDGLLSEPERVALEARAQTDAALRRRLAATQLLAREARHLPNAAAPRNFILPRDFGQNKPPSGPQSRRSLFPAWVFRIGSAAAALLFVSVLALEVTRPVAFSPSSLPYAAPAPAPAEAPAAPMADMARNAMEATVTMDVLAEGATTNVQPMAATVALPTLDLAQAQTKAAPGASVLSSSEANGAAGSAASAAPEALLLTATPAPAPAATLPEIATGPGVSQRNMFTVPAAAVTAAESQTVATPAPAVTSPPTQPEPLITPLRALAVIALVAAIVLGALGWLRR